MGSGLPTAETQDLSNYGLGEYDGYCEFVLRADTATFEFGGLATLASSAVVNWGDGSPIFIKESFTSTPVTHTYPDQTEDKVLRVWLKGFKPNGSNNPNSLYANELYTPQASTKQIKAIRKYIILNPDVTRLYYLFSCSSSTTGYYNLEELCNNAIYLPNVTNGTAGTWFHAAASTVNAAYLKRIGDYAINLPGITGVLYMHGSSSSYYGAFRNLSRLTSVGKCFVYAPNATDIHLGSCFLNTNAVLASGAFSSFGNNILYPGALGAGPTVSAGCFQSFDDSEIHFGDTSVNTKNDAPVFSGYTKALPVGTFVLKDRSKMYFGGEDSSDYGAFYKHTKDLSVGVFSAHDSSTLNFGGNASSGYGAFTGYSYALPAGVFVANDNVIMNFGATGRSGKGAFAGYGQSLSAGIFVVNDNGTMNFGGNTSYGYGAFNDYTYALSAGVFVTNDNATMNFGGENGSYAYGAFNSYSLVLPAGLFNINGNVTMTFGGSLTDNNYVDGAFHDYKKDFVAGTFVASGNAKMTFGGNGLSYGGGAFYNYSASFVDGTFVVSENAIMTFGSNTMSGGQYGGAFYSYSKVFPAGTFVASDNATMTFGGNSSNAEGAFYDYNQAFPAGIFTSKDKVKMNFGGTNGGSGAFYSYRVAFIAGLFLAKDESVMSFGGQGGFGGAFPHINAASAPTLVSNLFVATDSAVMSFGGYGTSGSGAFANRALIFQAGTFLVKGSAVMTFGAEQGTGAFRITNAKFVAATFKGAENGTFDFGYFSNATAITGGAFSGTPGTNSDIATTAAQLVDLTDNASLGNVAGTFYSTGITGALPEWWNLSPEPSPHDLCFYGNDSATNIDSVPADWK